MSSASVSELTSIMAAAEAFFDISIVRDAVAAVFASAVSILAAASVADSIISIPVTFAKSAAARASALFPSNVTISYLQFQYPR